MKISELSSLTQTAPGRYAGAIDASWNQGRGCFGGLIAACIGSCAEREVVGRHLRSLSLNLCAPVEPGPFEIEINVERTGSLMSFLSVRVRSRDQTVVTGSLILAKSRARDADFDHLPPPALPPVVALPEFSRPPWAPAFTQHFDFRFVKGVPFTGSERGETGGWMRPIVPQDLDTPLALVLLDAWPLGMLTTLTHPRPAASVAIQFHLFPPLPASAKDEWYAVDVHTPLQREGYSDQVNSVWDASGRLIGRAHQLVALVR